MLSDPIADMFTRIRNASVVFKQEVAIPYSKRKEALAKILLEEKYLTEVKNEQSKQLILTLKYEDKEPVIRKIVRVSKPGLRVYSSCKRLPRLMAGYRLGIVSTPQGMMSDKKARKEKLGGEVICKIE
jgi:small subunit ribosomal protein S8